ncbi:MAG: hypothetical protein N2053_08650, partial [Chitinispirillaceae bacterium]|nr:hypothetical protein [Chitinispirillaceae bacterium]
MKTKVLYLFLLLFLVSFCKCFHQPNSGGTTDTGNARIAGVIYDTEGKKVAEAYVTVCPIN